MNEIPKKPESARVVPLTLLWISLAAPPSIVYSISLVVRFIIKGEPETKFLPAALIALFMFTITAVFLILFYHAVGQRYRGSSLEYLCAAFFLGQVIVCIGIWLCFFLPILRAI